MQLLPEKHLSGPLLPGLPQAGERQTDALGKAGARPGGQGLSPAQFRETQEEED